jgi:hypothetical protein
MDVFLEKVIDAGQLRLTDLPHPSPREAVSLLSLIQIPTSGTTMTILGRSESQS